MTSFVSARYDSNTNQVQDPNNQSVADLNIRNRYLSANGVHKPIGGLLSTGRSTVATSSWTMEAETDFYAAKLIVISHEATASTGYSAVVGATETHILAGTQAAMFQPQVGGVAYNALRSPTDDYGWNAVTWGGNATGDIPSGGSISTPKYVESDWIPCPSVPRAAGESSTRPLFMGRLYKDGSVNTGSFQSVASVANTRFATADNRGRVLRHGTLIGANAVSALGTSMSDGTSLWPVTTILRYSRPVVTVAAYGDSLTQGLSYAADGTSTWLWRACYDLSTPALPVIPQNFGYSGQTTATYLAAAKIFIPLTRPNIAFYSPWSPNDGVPTKRLVQDALARAAEFLDLCALYNVYPILWTPFSNDSYLLASDNIRKYVSAQVKALATAKGIGYADFGAVTGDGASPERYISDYKFDNTHINNAGIEAVAISAAKQALQRAL